MNNPLPLVPLSEVLSPISRPERVDPEKSYNILGAHWYAEGGGVPNELISDSDSSPICKAIDE